MYSIPHHAAITLLGRVILEYFFSVLEIKRTKSIEAEPIAEPSRSSATCYSAVAITGVLRGTSIRPS